MTKDPLDMEDHVGSVDGETEEEKEDNQKESIQEVSEDHGEQTSTVEKQKDQKQKQHDEFDMLFRIMKFKGDKGTKWRNIQKNEVILKQMME